MHATCSAHELQPEDCTLFALSHVSYFFLLSLQTQCEHIHARTGNCCLLVWIPTTLLHCAVIYQQSLCLASASDEFQRLAKNIQLLYSALCCCINPPGIPSAMPRNTPTAFAETLKLTRRIDQSTYHPVTQASIFSVRFFLHGLYHSCTCFTLQLVFHVKTSVDFPCWQGLFCLK